ncbi:MAG: TIR domain-containing protein [Desulfobacteraceae bacterium]|nr:TIR domain-containing protein [Desulfobacteraceae bacterium]
MGKRDSEKVFLSYASEDLKKVKEIYSGLTGRHLQVWLDKENVTAPGNKLPGAVTEVKNYLLTEKALL